MFLMKYTGVVVIPWDADGDDDRAGAHIIRSPRSFPTLVSNWHERPMQEGKKSNTKKQY